MPPYTKSTLLIGPKVREAVYQVALLFMEYLSNCIFFSNVGSSSAAVRNKTAEDLNNEDDDDSAAVEGIVAGQADGGGVCRPRVVQGG